MSYCVSINNSIGTPPHYHSVYFLQNNEISPVSETVAEQFQNSSVLIHSGEGRRDREVHAENPVIPGSGKLSYGYKPEGCGSHRLHSPTDY